MIRAAGTLAAGLGTMVVSISSQLGWVFFYEYGE